MVTHSSVLAWRIPATGEPCGLPFLGWCRVGHDWGDLAAAAAEKLHIYVYKKLPNNLQTCLSGFCLLITLSVVLL